MTVIRSDAAIDALITARRSRILLAGLPEGSQPSSLAEAHAMQDAMVAKLGERVAGWKVAINKDGVMRGVILGSRLLQSPASIPAADVPLLGVEGEVAFRFDRDLFPRGNDYSAEEITAATTALVGIEIVASRFTDYAKTPILDRTVDLMSNGAFITGTVRPDWRQTDLSKLEAILRVNGAVAVQKTAAHATGDPIVPAVALVNELRRTTGVKSGQIITTGTYTGLHFVRPGDAIEVEFTGFGTAAVTIAR
jgi:2-keto-4-pentenoate hydratase